MSDSDVIRVQVLVAGAGPAGLVTAIILAKYNVDVLVVEKRVELSSLSRSLVVSTRSMEILRSWGIEDQVRAGSADVTPRGWVTHTLASRQGREIPLGHPTGAQAAKVSPCQPAWTPQDHLEPLLLELLHDAPGVEVKFGCELVSLRQNNDKVRATLSGSGPGRTREVEALYLVGADGAHSTVREHLGIHLEGPGALAEHQSIQFRAPLFEVVGDRRYGINVITHPEAAGTLAPRGPNDRWHYGKLWRPGQARLVDCSSEQHARLIATAVGVPSLRPHIERVSSYSAAAQIADRYRERRGILVGDAAHRMTPRGGTGMNTAIQDAHDLAWKLAWVLRGWAQPSLLDSYETDRRPVGLHNVTRSADPNGAQRQAEEALVWDLNGRLPHRWVLRGRRTVSTLDLLGSGLTLLAGPDCPGSTQMAAMLSTRTPVAVHILDRFTAHELGIPVEGAILVRPDAHRLLGWPPGGESLPDSAKAILKPNSRNGQRDSVNART
jgi:2-polyprenyl-6-methoxyphenol hydroxylase-like FAD-dependent oxidoreductase